MKDKCSSCDYETECSKKYKGIVTRCSNYKGDKPVEITEDINLESKCANCATGCEEYHQLVNSCTNYMA